MEKEFGEDETMNGAGTGISQMDDNIQESASQMSAFLHRSFGEFFDFSFFLLKN